MKDAGSILESKMYYPQPEKEPSGCIQTLVITRVILGVLLIPVGLIAGVMFLITLFIYLLTISPPLALIPIAIGGLALFLFARWEKRRAEKDIPPEDR